MMGFPVLPMNDVLDGEAVSSGAGSVRWPGAWTRHQLDAERKVFSTQPPGHRHLMLIGGLRVQDPRVCVRVCMRTDQTCPIRAITRRHAARR